MAALDLEIRGAGNLLGGEQSGHIDAVGFEMYMKLLEETVRELKGEEIEDDARATVNLRRRSEDRRRLHPRHEPAADGLSQGRGDANRERARGDARRSRAIATARRPTSVLNLAEYGRIRIMADRLGVETIDREGRLVVIKFRPQAKMDPVRLVKVVHEWPGAIAGSPGVA